MTAPKRKPGDPADEEDHTVWSDIFPYNPIILPEVGEDDGGEGLEKPDQGDIGHRERPRDPREGEEIQR